MRARRDAIHTVVTAGLVGGKKHRKADINGHHSYMCKCSYTRFKMRTRERARESEREREREGRSGVWGVEGWKEGGTNAHAQTRMERHGAVFDRTCT